MESPRCTQCGLVNLASATQCRRCSAILSSRGARSRTHGGDGTSVLSSGGIPEGVKVALIVVIACVVCTVTISWVKPYLAGGSYLVLFFIPFAFVGLLSGLIVVNILNLVYKVIIPKS